MPTSEKEKSSTGLLSIIKNLLNEPMPKGVSWPHTLGSSLLVLTVLQFVTGILLALYYSPNANAAYESVLYIEQYVLFGSLIRGLHYFAASGMIILIFLHMIRTFFYGAYKRPRQWTWIFGVILFLLVLGLAFTGYLLPWDMKAYFATKVGINIGGVVPVLGSYLIKIMQGGHEMSTITLSRFFAIHVVILPLLLVLLIGGHLYYIRLHGPTPPWLKESDPVKYTNRFYPQQLFRDSLVVFLVILLLLFLAAKFGAPLDAKADPNDTNFIPRPDWYFYSLFQLLKIFEGKLEIIGAVILPGVFFTLLIILPFLDRNPERRIAHRPIAVSLGSATVVVILFLTTWGAYEGNKVKKQMVAKVKELPTEEKIQKRAKADLENGKMLFTELKCWQCHEKVSHEENIPPGLEFSGNKYIQMWLINYLQDPYRIRWLRKNERPVIRMPNFNLSPQEALNISAYLMSFKLDKKFPLPDFDWTEGDSEMVQSGQDLVLEYGCFGCHKIQDSGQNIGPDLSHVGSKLRKDYMYHLIKAPHNIIPGTSMKDFKLEDEEVEDMVAYLGTLK